MNDIQNKILDYLKNHDGKTLTEIKKYLGDEIQKPIVLYHLKKLMDLGRILRNENKVYEYYSGQNIQLIKLPYFGEAKAGVDAILRGNEEPDYFIAVSPSCLRGYNPRDLFIIQVSGDSMEPTLFEGTYVVIKKEVGSTPKDNDIVLYKTEYEEIKIKRFKHMGNYAILWSDNFNKYRPIEINEETDYYLGRMIGRIN